MNNERDPHLSCPIDARSQAQIGRKLRGQYDGLVGEALPDQFLLLLDELARRETFSGPRTERPA